MASNRQRTYSVWWHMVHRCSNPRSAKYRRYGGRGIEVCSRWSGSAGFENFLSDMGLMPENPDGLRRYWSLDRIDNDGHYEPGNCRWATPKVQSRVNVGNTFGRALGGRPKTDEHRTKIGAAHKGKRHTEQSKAKMRGRVVSAETRARIAASRVGMRLSPEHRAAIAAGTKAAWDRRASQ